MRIAIAYANRRKIGGIETYLSGIIPELARLGHTLAFWYELEGPTDRDPIALPAGVPTWCVADLGAACALTALHDWQPDVIYAHGLHNLELEAEMLKIAPAVFFAHGYYGTCISGAKTFKLPVVIPCTRRFGWPCLLHYYPHRCGGLSPTTMLRMYRLQSKRLDLLHRYKAIVTHSDHMISEYAKHGLAAERAYQFPYDSLRTETIKALEPNAGVAGHLPDSAIDGQLEDQLRVSLEQRLLFSGRMDRVKGGAYFLEALPKVATALDARLRVTFAGDGSECVSWKRTAARIQESHPKIHVEFTGWISESQLECLLDDADLLVVPSLWPEPFGLVGLEAGIRGVPTAAFAVGGIRDWLTDGINGFLAPGDPPTADGLAEAIIKCLRDPNVYARLRRGAVELAQRFSLEKHINALQEVFEKVRFRPV